MKRSAGGLGLAVWRAVFVLALLRIGACQRAGDPSLELAMASESALPDFLRGAPTQVREAYRFAIANRELLSAMPCYCGCGSMGHRSNLDCYIKSVRADGSIEFENHAFGWSICVDITRDVMRLRREGKDVKAIRASVDTEYRRYGQTTDTPPAR